VEFIPLALPLLRDYTETHKDGSNSFIYSRFLVPYLRQFQGWALFADGDMLCRADISELWRMRDDSKAAMVVQHSYRTKYHRKYIGTSMETHNPDYPRKNWSSLVLWNCNHPSNSVLTPRYVSEQPGSHLHRFAWLAEDEIGELPATWNWLVGEYEHLPDAKLVHYTLGVPGIAAYSKCDHAAEWIRTRDEIGVVEV
jgi:lipopolysaccharide biosynthesis glycosyltransferase